jgi:hypothetical protein
VVSGGSGVTASSACVKPAFQKQPGMCWSDYHVQCGPIWQVSGGSPAGEMEQEQEQRSFQTRFADADIVFGDVCVCVCVCVCACVWMILATSTSARRRGVPQAIFSFSLLFQWSGQIPVGSRDEGLGRSWRLRHDRQQ